MRYIETRSSSADRWAKVREAIVIGVLLWMGGAIVLLLFGRASFYSRVAFPATLLMFPAMYLVTRVHLRDVPREQCAYAGLRLGVIATAAQCPLDLLAFWSIFNVSFLALTPEALEATVLVLEVGYFSLLVVPWWCGTRI